MHRLWGALFYRIPLARTCQLTIPSVRARDASICCWELSISRYRPPAGLPLCHLRVPRGIPLAISNKECRPGFLSPIYSLRVPAALLLYWGVLQSGSIGEN